MTKYLGPYIQMSNDGTWFRRPFLKDNIFFPQVWREKDHRWVHTDNPLFLFNPKLVDKFNKITYSSFEEASEALDLYFKEKGCVFLTQDQFDKLKILI